MLLTIITINFNNKIGLEDTIKSVIPKLHSQIEWVVIDGGSTDGSLDVIHEYCNYINFVVSEPDHGIYNAMNKGVNHSHGKYCLFLNSGDIFVESDFMPNLLEKVSCSDVDLIIGRLYQKDCNNNITPWTFPKKIDGYNLILYSLPHPSTLIKTQLLKEHPYRENYKIVSDWLFFLEMILLKNRSFCVIDEFISIFSLGGISGNNAALCKEERVRGFKELFGQNIYQDYQRLVYGETTLEKNVRYLEQFNLFNKMMCKVISLMVSLHKCILKIKNI